MNKEHRALTQGGRSSLRSDMAQQLIFIGPGFIFFMVIVLIPFILGMYYSFTDWNGVTGKMQWVGFDNFRQGDL